MGSSDQGCPHFGKAHTKRVGAEVVHTAWRRRHCKSLETLLFHILLSGEEQPAPSLNAAQGIPPRKPAEPQS